VTLTASTGPAVKPDLAAVPPRSRVPRLANATLVGREDLGSAMAWFRFRHDDGPRPFSAGQYVQIAVADLSTPPRPYSIACGPGSSDLDFVISLVAGGALSPRLFGLRLGERVYVGEARGLFRLDDADVRDHLLIGTGSGIAPLLSMIAALGSRPVPPRTVLLHGVRERRELAGQDVAAQWDGRWLSYRPILSRATATPGWTGRRGRVGMHLDALIADAEMTPEGTVAYLCGSPDMIEDCSLRLATFEMPSDAIRSERFVTVPNAR
jgi:ferredoxin-NADP reductase